MRDAAEGALVDANARAAAAEEGVAAANEKMRAAEEGVAFANARAAAAEEEMEAANERVAEAEKGKAVAQQGWAVTEAGQPAADVRVATAEEGRAVATALPLVVATVLATVLPCAVATALPLVAEEGRGGQPGADARVAAAEVGRGVAERALRSGDTTPCVKSLRSSYTGLYPQRGGVTGAEVGGGGEVEGLREDLQVATPLTLHPIPCIPHPTLYTLHHTPYIVHPTHG